VLVGGPVVVWNGKVSVNPREQGFRDSRLFARKARTAVGVTRNGKLLMVAVTKPVYLRSLGKAMKALGCTRAAALDGGGSTALYYRGKSLAKPSRRLTNLLVAYDTTAAHARVMDALAPAPSVWALTPGNITR
jgi:exopolysaccharide biosynthesis protein